MKRVRRDEPSVWPSKKVVTSSSNANAQWPLATQPSRSRDRASLLLPNTVPGAAETALPSSSVASVPPQFASVNASADVRKKPPMSPPSIFRNDLINGGTDSKEEKNDMKPPHIRKTYPPQVPEQSVEGEPRTEENNVTKLADSKKDTTGTGSSQDRYHDIPGALAFMIDQEAEAFSLGVVNRLFVWVSGAAALTWLLLIGLAYRVAPKGNVVYLDPVEQSSAVIAASTLLLIMSSKLAPLFMARGWKAFSGILIGALTIQLVAVTTNLFMALTKVPVMMDPVTGARVFILRWCEWTPLAFSMTFFTEGVDSVGLKKPINTDCSRRENFVWYWQSFKIPFLLSAAQGVSTFCGFLFPFCPDLWWWSIEMLLSCVLYASIFPRLLWKRNRLKVTSMKQSTEDAGNFERVQLSYRLLFTCTICWSLLVVFYFVGAFAHMFSPPESFWGSQSLPFLCDTLMDVIVKGLYMDVIVDVHKLMFDETARVTRRMQELRRMMAVVWDCSSDVIALSMRGSNGAITTMISPTFHKIEQCNDDESAPIVFEIESSELFGKANDTGFESDEVYVLDVLPTGEVSARTKALNRNKHPGFFSMRKLVRTGWTISSDEQMILDDIHLANDTIVHCETKATRLGPNALILVLRDISERCKRFEAEKVAVSESTARRKDEEANRFTRHEVKNGLLASIGLCDSLREAISEETGSVIDRNSSGSLSNLRLMAMLESNKREKWKDPLSLHRKKPGKDGLHRLIKELDLTLRDILDTVLAEAMARDVIHEVYRPKLERVDIASMLGGDSAVTNRFPVVTDPSPLPLFLFDLQLLKYIHRNAVSNACKYGKKGGVVLTEVRYFSLTNEIQMNVINLPGENHARILAMGNDAASAVFAPGKRLQLKDDTSEGTASHSSGDGAWISRKCAKTLGGNCSIQFEQNRTIFSLKCPVTRYDVALGVPSNFSLPENTWGIAIDDSKIQRKMLQRFFSLAGVKKKQQVLLGQSPNEIRCFNQTVIDLVKQHPDAYFLLIVDENLDIISAESHTEHTISGSLTIQKLRMELGPELEQRLLAVVRSANDSATDIEVYSARAHGFLYKAPIQKEKIMEVLAPLWVKRFAQRFPDSVADVRKEEAVPDVSAPKAELETDDFVSAASDVMETLEVIDALCMEDEAVLSMRWSLIWKKLQSLKTELQTLEKSDVVEEALVSIDKMNGSKIAEDFLSQWAALRSLIIRVV